MKGCIIAALAVLASSSLFAQKNELSLSGGMSFTTAPAISATYDSYNSSVSSAPASSIATFRVARNIRKWRVGAEAGYTHIDYRFHGSGYYLINGVLVALPRKTMTGKLGQPAIPLRLSVDRKFNFGNVQIYAGANAGMVLLHDVFIPPAENDPAPYSIVNGSGYTVGVQAGSTWYFTKKFGLNAELQANYMDLAVKSVHYKLIQVPLTMGLRYRF